MLFLPNYLHPLVNRLCPQFKFAGPADRALIAVGILLALVSSAGTSLHNIIRGEVLNAFATHSVSSDLLEDPGDLAAAGAALRTGTDAGAWRAVVLGLGVWLLCYTYAVCLNFAAERQVWRVRN